MKFNKKYIADCIKHAALPGDAVGAELGDDGARVVIEGTLEGVLEGCSVGATRNRGRAEHSKEVVRVDVEHVARVARGRAAEGAVHA